MKYRCAILDDYQNVALKLADWSSLKDKIVTLLEQTTPGDVKATIHDNRVRIRVVKAASRRAPKLVGFVHNPDVDPVQFLDLNPKP